MVYVFRKDNEYLYIGCSKNGLERVFAACHKKARQAQIEATHLDMILCSSVEEMTKLEAAMILKNKPLLNESTGKPNYRVRRAFQKLTKSVTSNDVKCHPQDIEITSFTAKLLRILDDK